MSSLSTSFAHAQKRERSMLTDWLIKISDYGDVALSKGIHYVGIIVGIGGGSITYVGNEIAKQQKSVSLIATQAPALPDWVVSVLPYAGIVTMAAGCILILKHIVDMSISVLRLYYERKDKANGENNS